MAVRLVVVKTITPVKVDPVRSSTWRTGVVQTANVKKLIIRSSA